MLHQPDMLFACRMAEAMNDKSQRTQEAPLHTPDGRYIVVRGRLWRAASPCLPEPERQAAVHRLMAARRAVAAALRCKDGEALRQARSQVQQAKLELGERGPVWWTDGAKDYNRYLVKNTPYAQWFSSLSS